MLAELEKFPKVVGTKQVKRALSSGKVRQVFLAQDADPRIIHSIVAFCTENGVETETVSSMRELGRLCGISVGASTAALLR